MNHIIFSIVNLYYICNFLKYDENLISNIDYRYDKTSLNVTRCEESGQKSIFLLWAFYINIKYLTWNKTCYFGVWSESYWYVATFLFSSLKFTFGRL